MTAEQENFTPTLAVAHEQNVAYMLSMMTELNEQGVQYYTVESEQPPEPPGFLPRQSVNALSQAKGGTVDLAGGGPC